VNTRTRWIVTAVVAFGAAASAFASSPPSGEYRGKTVQGLTAIVVVKGNDVVKADFHVSDNCGKTFPIIAGGRRYPIRNGGFRIGATFEGGFVRIAGRFSGRRVTGTIRERTSPPGSPPCDTGVLTYTARLR
jgi:hypothetical protein